MSFILSLMLVQRLQICDVCLTLLAGLSWMPATCDL